MMFALNTLYFKAKNKINTFIHGERGAVDMIVIIVLIVIALAIALIFKDKITELVNNLWENIFSQTDKITGTDTAAAA